MNVMLEIRPGERRASEAGSGKSAEHPPERRAGRVFKHALLLFCCVVAHVTVAQGHATLLETSPVADAKLVSAPGEVTLLFDERVETIFNSIRVVDGHGNRVDVGSARAVGSGDRVTVGLKALAEGPYAVFWRVTSADGHQVEGSFGFGVRAAPPDRDGLFIPFNPREAFFTRWYQPAAKWIVFTAMAFWFGSIGFWLLVFGPASGGQDSAVVKSAIVTLQTLEHLMVWAGLVYFVGECLALAGQAVAMADVPFAKVISPAVLGTVLAQTRYGSWWIVRIVSAMLLLAVCYAKLRPSSTKDESESRETTSTAWKVVAAVLSGLLLASITLSGHAGAVQKGTAVAVGVDWLHLVASAIWIGGLFSFAIAVSALRRCKGHNGEGYAALICAMANRFSVLARLCVVVLAVTGTYSAWLHIPRIASFVSTSYGRVLLAKIAIFSAILIVAVFNWRRVLPALSARPSRTPRTQAWANRFKGLLQAEAAMGAMVLGMVAVLTSLPPANAVAGGPIDMSRRSGDVTVHLHIVPNRLGRNEAVVALTDARGQAVVGAKHVTVYLRSQEMDMGLETVEGVPSHDGEYQADVALTMAGRWLVSVEVSPPKGDDFVTDFEISSTM